MPDVVSTLYLYVIIVKKMFCMCSNLIHYNKMIYDIINPRIIPVSRLI